MFIDITDIAAEGKKVSGKLNLGTLPWKQREKIKVTDAAFEAFLQWKEKSLYLKGKVHFSISLQCSRCLEPFSTFIDSEFKLNLKEETNSSQTGNKLMEKEEVHIFPIKGTKIDMKEILSEQVYLNLPLKPLCTQNCHGLCSLCGANLNKNKCQCSE